jgi:hypothetical protein
VERGSRTWGRVVGHCSSGLVIAVMVGIGAKIDSTPCNLHHTTHNTSYNLSRN